MTHNEIIIKLSVATIHWPTPEGPKPSPCLRGIAILALTPMCAGIRKIFSGF